MAMKAKDSFGVAISLTGGILGFGAGKLLFGSSPWTLRLAMIGSVAAVATTYFAIMKVAPWDDSQMRCVAAKRGRKDPHD